MYGQSRWQKPSVMAISCTNLTKTRHAQRACTEMRTNMDKIIIENLNLYAHHGVYQEETEKGQNFYLHVGLETDTRKAGLLDDLELSTDYGEVWQFLHQFLHIRHGIRRKRCQRETPEQALSLLRRAACQKDLPL